MTTTDTTARGDRLVVRDIELEVVRRGAGRPLLPRDVSGGILPGQRAEGMT